MNENITTERCQWIDMTKGLAIIFVVVGHSMSWNGFLNNIFFSVHMPIFFIVAGYTFNYKREFEVFISRKIQNILLPYFFTLFFDEIIWLVYAKNLLADNSNIFNHFLYSCKVYAVGLGINEARTSWTEINPVGVVWFLPCLFIAEFIFFLIIKICQEDILKIGFVSIILTLSGFLLGTKIFLPWSTDIALFAQIFLFAGFYIKEKSILTKELNPKLTFSFFLIWAIGICSFPISMNDRKYSIVVIPVMCAIIGSMLIMKFMLWLERKDTLITSFFCYLGRYSIMILIFHLKDIGSLHLDLVEIYSFLYKNSRLDYSLILIIARLAVCVLLIEIFRRIPGLRNVYGLTKVKYENISEEIDDFSCMEEDSVDGFPDQSDDINDKTDF